MEGSVQFGNAYLNIDSLYLLEIRQCGATMEPVLGVLDEAAVTPFTIPAPRPDLDMSAFDRDGEVTFDYDRDRPGILPIGEDSECSTWTDRGMVHGDIWWPGPANIELFRGHEWLPSVTEDSVTVRYFDELLRFGM